VAKRTPVVRKLGRPRDADSSDTRQNLLEVARRIFARDGYGATTNRSIADEAGITTGAIYHYFPSKAELYAGVYQVVLSLVADSFDAAIAAPGSLITRFSRALDTAASLNRSDSSITGFLVSVPSELQRHPELVELVRPLRNQAPTFIGRLVLDAEAAGEFRPDVQPRAVEDLLTAVLSGLATFSTVTGDVQRHRDAIGALQQFLAGELIVAASPVF